MADVEWRERRWWREARRAQGSRVCGSLEGAGTALSCSCQLSHGGFERALSDVRTEWAPVAERLALPEGDLQVRLVHRTARLADIQTTAANRYRSRVSLGLRQSAEECCVKPRTSPWQLACSFRNQEESLPYAKCTEQAIPDAGRCSLPAPRQCWRSTRTLA
ncbi:hypothetical protein OH77DRAFT_325583 [Trametes cingulata]|nr:hypothetical protein OH77DRAFT_325583 [Trametes cingulata]